MGINSRIHRAKRLGMGIKSHSREWEWVLSPESIELKDWGWEWELSHRSLALNDWEWELRPILVNGNGN